MSVDLSTYYLGMKLKNPLGVAACPPLTGNLDMLRQLEDAGASVAVLPSLFEEQIEHDELEFNRLFEYQSESFAEALTHFPVQQEYNTGPRDYLRHIVAAKQAVSIPIIGSLNGSSTGGWIRYAKMIEEAGADALELNIYFVPTDA
ncbi:MAG: dihydroorotate dehydrogenase-like protein, partial [Planctomycetia bacterium]|nr:dihydroorotate dehydrogenase-like protein [Planctomycetia bacterium]